MTVTAKDAAAVRFDARRMGVGELARTHGITAVQVLAILGRTSPDPDEAEALALAAVNEAVADLTPAARARVLHAASRVRCPTCDQPTGATPGAWVDVCTCPKET